MPKTAQVASGLLVVVADHLVEFDEPLSMVLEPIREPFVQLARVAFGNASYAASRMRRCRNRNA